MKRRMGILLSLVLVWICVFALADVAIDEAHFPDENFRDAIAAFDTDGSGQLDENEIGAAIKIEVAGKSITDFTGIRYFTALKELDCRDNQLESLDLRENTALVTLICSGNRLAELDISAAENMDYLNCASNQITSLTLNTMLTYLNCDGNQLERINVQENTKLRNLICSNNQLQELDVSKNTLLLYLTCSDNKIPNLDLYDNTKLRKLTCSHNKIVELWVRNVPKLDSLVREKEPQRENGLLTWSADDDGDGKADRALTVDQATRIRDSSFAVYGGMIEINEDHFPDENFRRLVTGFDTDNDGFLSAEEINGVYDINCQGKSIRSLQGI